MGNFFLLAKLLLLWAQRNTTTSRLSSNSLVANQSLGTHTAPPSSVATNFSEHFVTLQGSALISADVYSESSGEDETGDKPENTVDESKPVGSILVSSNTAQSFSSTEEKEEKKVVNGTTEFQYGNAYRAWLAKVKHGYEEFIRPSFGAEPDEIKISIYVMAVRSVSEVTMDFSLEMYFRQLWLDRRLTFDAKSFGGRQEIDVDAAAREHLWVPDTNLVNAVSSSDPTPGSMTHMEHIRVNASGRVLQSKRVSVTAQCQMNLRFYPYDEQVCSLYISSYGFRNTELLYSWGEPAVEMTSATQLPDFNVRAYQVKSSTAEYAIGNFSTLEFCFVLRRNAGYCMVQLILPATVLVAASWTSLWLEDEMVFADILSVILSILFLSYSYNNVMPKVSYLKGMDMYLGGCLLFTFMSLVKMAIVKYLRKRALKHDEKANQHRRRSCFEDTNLLAVSSSGASPFTNAKALEAGAAKKQPITSRQLPQLQPIKNELPQLEPIKTKQHQEHPIMSELSRFGFLQQYFERALDAASTKIHSRAWRNMKTFHYASQIMLPVAFGLFSFYFFVIFPALATTHSCESEATQ